MAIKASEVDIEAYPPINPQTFSVPCYYVGYGILAIDLATIGEEELRSFVARAWRRTAPKSLVKAWDNAANTKMKGLADHSMRRKRKGS